MITVSTFKVKARSRLSLGQLSLYCSRILEPGRKEQPQYGSGEDADDGKVGAGTFVGIGDQFIADNIEHSPGGKPEREPQHKGPSVIRRGQ